MTKLCRQYLAEIKPLFPVLGKPEKIYLAKLTKTVEDYCAEENITTLEEIHRDFGQPSEIVHTYISNMDSAQLIKRIRFSKWIKRGIFTVLLLIFILAGIRVLILYKHHKIFEQQSIYFEETIIY